MSQKVSGKCIASAGAFNINIGFIPDYLDAISALGGTELEFEFYKVLADLEVAGRYGFTLSTSGVPEPCASAAAGIIPYDESKDVVLVESPAPGGVLVKCTVVDYTVAVSTAATARTATVCGTIVRPTTHNGYVYECTTAGTGSAEPTWPTTPGATVTDGTTVFTCREENVSKGGGKGVTIGADIASDGELWVFRAEKHDRVGDFGDADAQNPVTL